MMNRLSLPASISLQCVVPCLTLICVTGCGEQKRAAKSDFDSSSVAAVARSAKPARHFSRTDFANLRWLEGDWRGRLPNGGYFYERYRIVDDSTIAMHGFEDSTFSNPNDSASIVYRDGIVTDRSSTSRYVATNLALNGVAFAPTQGATNHFSWNRESADTWTANLRSAKGNITVYRMERVRPK
jgi:hypothetical protein